MTNVTFLGGCQQVGASAILVEQDGTRVVMDYGTAFNGDHRVPLPTSTQNLVSVLSHAHLDHSGNLPLITGSQTHHVPLYTTALTKDLLHLLLMDMLKISGNSLAFERKEIQRLLKNTRTIEYKTSIQVHPKIWLTLHDAGHIPGSASILIETEQNGGRATRIFYTGDLNTADTRLVKGAAGLRNLGELDLVIVESTYALENHPPRQKVEDTFVNMARTTLEAGGTVLVPAFAVGRSQEILSVLFKHRHRGLDYPIFIDGMARDVTRIMKQYSKAFSGGSTLVKATNNATFIRNNSDRQKAVNEPAVIIAPAGMLKGGTAQKYLQNIAGDSRSSILLVGKQLPGTPGATLLEHNEITLNKREGNTTPLRVKAKVTNFDFSCHVGRQDVLNFLRDVKGTPKIITMHGEATACQNLAQTLRNQFGFEANAATCGQRISFN